MEIAIIGYGKMGHAIERIAIERGHKTICTIDNSEEFDSKSNEVKHCDIAIEFTQPAVAPGNIKRCIELGVPVVCGTTGWYAHYDELATLCRRHNGAMLTATNFSIGMNIMFALNERLAELMRSHREYKSDISETHHIHKLDAPSGTAITLQQQITGIRGCGTDEVPIQSFRIGEVPGTHTVRYDSFSDTISLTHEAHNREGLALGAVLAAEFLAGKKGIFTMKDVL